MSIKNKKARKLYWSKMPKEIKSARMSEIAKKRHQKYSIEKRKEIGKMLLIARRNKKNTIKSLSN